MRVGRLLALSVVLASAVAWAEGEAAPPEPQLQLRWQPGPRSLELGHEVELALPAHYVFLGMPDADRLLQKLGTFHNENLLGVVVDENPQAQWAVIIRYDEDGHVDDGEKVDADELMKALREGTDEANKERVDKGFPALHIDRWSEPPHYDRAVHHLVWALDVSSSNGTTVNYNTRVLGRRGVVSLNLVTDPAALAVDQVHGRELLAATTFKQGARYQDFDKKTDKVAEYGLMGLILGGAGLGAAKLVKIGLLAKFWKVFLALLLAGKKAVIFVFVALGAGLKRLFGKKPASPPTGTDRPNT